MIKKKLFLVPEPGHATVKYFNKYNFISFLKWMCPTKALLKSFADSNPP